MIPPLEGIERITAWTNRETYTVTGRAVIIGGSAVGVETATFLARFGVKVTLSRPVGDRDTPELPWSGHRLHRHPTGFCQLRTAALIRHLLFWRLNALSAPR